MYCHDCHAHAAQRLHAVPCVRCSRSSAQLIGAPQHTPASDGDCPATHRLLLLICTTPPSTGVNFAGAAGTGLFQHDAWPSMQVQLELDRARAAPAAAVGVSHQEPGLRSAPPAELTAHRGADAVDQPAQGTGMAGVGHNDQEASDGSVPTSAVADAEAAEQVSQMLRDQVALLERQVAEAQTEMQWLQGRQHDTEAMHERVGDAERRAQEADAALRVADEQVEEAQRACADAAAATVAQAAEADALRAEVETLRAAAAAHLPVAAEREAGESRSVPADAPETADVSASAEVNRLQAEVAALRSELQAGRASAGAATAAGGSGTGPPPPPEAEGSAQDTAASGPEASSATGAAEESAVDVEVLRVRRKLQAAIKKGKAVTAERDQLRGQVEALQTELEGMSADALEKEARLVAAEAELQDGGFAGAGSVGVTAEAAAEVAELRREVVEAAARLKEVRAEAAAAAAARDVQNAEMEVLVAQVQELEGARSAAAAEAAAAVEAARAAEDAAEVRAEEVARLEGRVSELEGAVREVEEGAAGRVAALEASAAAASVAANAAAQAAAVESAGLTAEVASVRAQLEELEAELEAARGAERTALAAQVAAGEREAALEAAVEEREAQHAAVRAPAVFSVNSAFV